MLNLFLVPYQQRKKKLEMNEVSIETETVTTLELKVLNDDVLNTFETIKLQTDNSNKIDQ
jgi:hypothetical protein